MLLINHFLINTSTFLDQFADVCEKKLGRVTEKIEDIEILLVILEKKLNSIPGFDDGQGPLGAAACPILSEPSASSSSSSSSSYSSSSSSSANIPADPNASPYSSSLPNVPSGVPDISGAFVPQSSSTSLVPFVDPSMMVVPYDANNSQANADGLPPQPPLASIPPPAPDAALNNPKYEPYKKMRRAGLPDGAIRQKMTSNNDLTPAERDAFFSASAAVPPAAPAPVVSPPPAPTVAPPAAPKIVVPDPPAPPPVSAAAKDPKYAKYASMQKSGLPEGAIRQKMSMDGTLSKQEMDAFFT